MAIQFVVLDDGAFNSYSLKIKSSIWFTCLKINSKQMVQQTNGSTI